MLIFISHELFSLDHIQTKPSELWGFYAHKLLNRLAVFTLPDPMIEFYKTNIAYLEEHAIDPDKRRYAIRGEAIRHYIDLDQWVDKNGDDLPRNYEEAIIRTAEFYYLVDHDTCLVFDTTPYLNKKIVGLNFTDNFKTKYTTYKQGLSLTSLKYWMYNHAMLYFAEKEWLVPNTEVEQLDSTIFKYNGQFLIVDHFSKHGIIPYSLPKFYMRLVNAFKEQNTEKILKLSADIGHYVGDAHVPLHTTKNYNGQLTNQDGIHAFWESRIPELFAESDFDFVVGQAEYQSNISDFTWRIIKKAHSYVDSVLLIEKRLSQLVMEDKQYCFENRLGNVTKLPCRDYASLYNKTLDNQVEDQFRSCILNIGSFWMSAWTDAGQPDLSKLKFGERFLEFQAKDSLDSKNGTNDIRNHE